MWSVVERNRKADLIQSFVHWICLAFSFDSIQLFVFELKRCAAANSIDFLAFVTANRKNDESTATQKNTLPARTQTCKWNRRLFNCYLFFLEFIPVAFSCSHSESIGFVSTFLSSLILFVIRCATQTKNKTLTRPFRLIPFYLPVQHLSNKHHIAIVFDLECQPKRLQYEYPRAYQPVNWFSVVRIFCIVAKRFKSNGQTIQWWHDISNGTGKEKKNIGKNDFIYNANG